MMRLLVISDLHLEQIGPLDPFVDPNSIPDADIAIVAGDLHSPASASIAWLQRMIARKMPIVFVMGNHEFYGSDIDVESDRAHALQRNVETTATQCMCSKMDRSYSAVYVSSAARCGPITHSTQISIASSAGNATSKLRLRCGTLVRCSAIIGAFR